MRAWTLLVLTLAGAWQSSSVHAASPVVTVQINLAWEGRDLQKPNLEALQQFRLNFSAIPVTHLVNPIYFLTHQAAEKNWQEMDAAFHGEDEVGLYLSGTADVVREAGVIPKFAPTFWGYSGESDVCQADCGLDVPLTIYNREEILKIFNFAHQTLIRSGFEKLSSLAVRGWLVAPFLRAVAAVYGYKNDLTQVDPQLINRKLREFPLATWVNNQGEVSLSGDLLSLAASGVKPLVHAKQAGGILDLNETREIMARFDRFLSLELSDPRRSEVFSLGVSTESFFQAWPKLKFVLDSMLEIAKQQNFAIEFTTASAAKNGRPHSENMRISTKP